MGAGENLRGSPLMIEMDQRINPGGFCASILRQAQDVPFGKLGMYLLQTQGGVIRLLMIMVSLSNYMVSLSNHDHPLTTLSELQVEA